MRQEIEVLSYANDILKAVKTGVLLTTKVDDKVNCMTISWGTIGIEWAKPIFTVFIRENRFSKSQLDKNGEFTINVPYGEYDKKILNFCGTNSGRDVDKIKELGLTLISPQIISVPAIKELALTLECKVIYKQKQDENAVTEANRIKFYPQDVDSFFCGANRDYHTAYYGEVVSAYICL